jgi:lysophospholipase L1-like esterase
MKGQVVKGFILITLSVLAGTLPAQAALKAATVGDSITQGVPIYNSKGNGCTDCGGYQPGLKALLDAKNNESNTVYNYGIAGETSNAGAARIPSIISGKNPDYVLYMEGTNDLVDYSPSTVAERVKIAVNNILAQGKTAVVGTLIPDLKYAPKSDKKGIPETNGYIRTMVAQKQAANKKVYLAELHDDGYWGWGSSPTMSSDGLHPNAAGYQQMAEIWFSVLRGFLGAGYLPAIYLLLFD